MSDAAELVSRQDGMQIRFRGRFLYSDHTPRSGAERRAAAAALPERHLIIVPSPLLWYGVEQLLQRSDAPGAVLCVELDSALAELSRRHLPPALAEHPRLRFITSDDRAVLDAAITELGSEEFSGCDIVSLTGGYALHRARYRALENYLRAVLRRNWQNRLSLIRLGRRWLINTFTNLPDLAESRPLTEYRCERPVVLIGAGESLEAHIPSLREHRGDICVVAADTALGPLTEGGVTPDLVVVLEAQLINLEHVLGMLDTGAAFAFELSSAPQLLRRIPPERRYFFASRFTETAALRRIEQTVPAQPWIAPRGSVAVAALEAIARAAGRAVTVHLIGMDFSFRLGKPHARGSGSHRWYLRYTERLAPDALYDQAIARPLVMFHDESGKPLRSDSILAGYRDQLQDAIAVSGVSARELTTGGAQSGLPTGFPRAGYSELSSSSLSLSPASSPMASARPTVPAAPPTAAGSSTAETDRSTTAERYRSVVNFLEQELVRLENAVADLERITKDTGDDALGETEALRSRVLTECDYLEIDFPTPTGKKPLTPQQVQRLLVSARHFRRVTRNASRRAREAAAPHAADR